MRKSLEEVIDLIIFVIFLASGMTLGVQGLYELHRVTYAYSLEVEDKNVIVKDYGVDYIGDYDGLLTPAELCLMTQIQDRGMPNPNSIMINGEIITIDIARADNTKSYIAQINDTTNNDYRYELKYNYKTETYYATPYLKTLDTNTGEYKYSAIETAIKIDGIYSILAGQQHSLIFQEQSVLNNGKTYLISFIAYSEQNGDKVHVDAWPDELPEKSFVLTNIPTEYSWLVTIPPESSDVPVVDSLRFFISDEINQGKITIKNINIIEY